MNARRAAPSALSPRALAWGALFAAILAAWAALAAMSAPAPLREAGLAFGPELLAALCGAGAGDAGFPALWAMWALMGVAMMAPTALPVFATYDALTRGERPGGLALLVAGYLAVWAGFAVAAAAAQTALASAGLVSAFGESRSALLSAALLAAAGAHQFSALKAACLRLCRAPLTVFFERWDEGPWRNGLRFGLACLGCCWALMLLAFVGGTMSLGFMGLATTLMALEKLPEIGRRLGAPLGWALLAAAPAAALGAI